MKDDDKDAAEMLLDIFKAYNQAGVLMQMDDISIGCKNELKDERDLLRANAVDFFNNNFARIARKAC